jgi:hypothetical protein
MAINYSRGKFYSSHRMQYGIDFFSYLNKRLGMDLTIADRKGWVAQNANSPHIEDLRQPHRHQAASSLRCGRGVQRLARVPAAAGHKDSCGAGLGAPGDR